MKHSHYFKDVEHLTHVDVYRVLKLFDVTDPCLQHAIKKLLVAGGRGGGKDISRDVQEAVDSLERWKAMKEEDARELVPKEPPTYTTTHNRSLSCGCADCMAYFNPALKPRGSA